MKQSLRWFYIRLLFHGVATFHLGYAVYFDDKYAELPWLAVELRIVTPLGGKFKYLAFLNALLHTIYFLLSTICDLRSFQGLQKVRDYLLATFVVPLSLTVCITFWTLCAINREAIYPNYLDVIYPVWLKHTTHTIPVVYALLELCVEPHRYPRRTVGYTGLGVALGCYLVWLKFVHYWTGIWVYPFLSVLVAPLRWFFFAVIVTLSFGCYFIGEQLNFALWSSQEKSQGLRLVNVIKQFPLLQFHGTHAERQTQMQC